MKRMLLLLSLLSFSFISFSQNVGIGTTFPGFPLNFASTIGDKISLWGNSGNHYGLSIQPNLLQVHTDLPGSDIGFGYGSSYAFNEVMRIKGNGNVGIGTSTPGFPLNFPNTLGDKISLYGNSGDHFGFGIQDYLLQIYSGSSLSDIGFGYGSSSGFTEVMRIKGSGNIGIGTSTPNSSAILHIQTSNDSQGLLVTGNYSTGSSIPDLGTGSRLMFYPGRSSFRVGYVSGPNWNNENVGLFSVAMGFNTMAAGIDATAIGASTSAIGDHSFATGVSSFAKGYSSSSFGFSTNAKGIYSTSMGDHTIAKGRASLVIGEYNDSLLLTDQSIISFDSSPLFIVGNGYANPPYPTVRKNAMTVWSDGNVDVANLRAATLKIGGGNAMDQQESGSINVGSSNSNHKTLTVTFGQPFGFAPMVVATIANQSGCSCDDTFAVTIRDISPYSVTFNIHRVDAGSWGQSPRLNWIAWR